jgi:4'-phosphopantetheinyl transferase
VKWINYTKALISYVVSRSSAVTIDISTWQASPPCLLIGAGELHLWRFRTDISTPTAEILRQSLSTDECVRADRLISPLHQLRFIAARSSLRRILSRYLQCPPDSIVFSYSQLGKPFLDEGRHRSGINFNLSHSGDWGVLAVTMGPDVGVDIEEVVIKANLQQLADYAFDEAEMTLFSDFHAARKQRGFFRLWTAKEARLKMLGIGLGKIKKEVSPEFGCFFVPAKGYVAAVAVACHVARIVRYRVVMT